MVTIKFPPAQFETVEVLNEEIIIHPTVERQGKGWKGEARVMGTVEIDGETYKFEKVIAVRFVKE